MQYGTLGNKSLPGSFDPFLKINDAIANVVSLPTAFRPEVALVLELWEAEKQGKPLTVSMLGLISGIPQSTTLRYLNLLENQGIVSRIAHPSDQRVTYMQLDQEVSAALSRAMGVGVASEQTYPFIVQSTSI